MFRLAVSVIFIAFAGHSDAHQKALDLYKQQRYPEAIAAFEVAVKGEEPQSAEFGESALLIGQSYFALGQQVKAIPWLEKVTGVNEANYMLGYAYLHDNQPEKSEAAFARLFGLRPESAEGHLLAAQMLIKQELENYAAIEAKKAIAIDPKLPGAHFLLAEIAIYSGHLAEGLAELNTEIANNPSFSMAWYRRGDVYVRQENWTAAIPDLQRAIWLNQNFSGPYILLGKCYFKTSNLVSAEQILRRALSLDPQNNSATFLLAQTLMKEGRTDEGKQLLQKVRSAKEEH